MITIITGATHTGKTALADRLMNLHKIPYISLDIIKRGLTEGKLLVDDLDDDDAITKAMWPVVREMIKASLAKNMDLIVEGRYIPSNWIFDFNDTELSNIKFVCLVMSEDYINNNYETILEHAEVIEEREEEVLKETLIEKNQKFRDMCDEYIYPYVEIDVEYYIDIDRLLL